MRGNILVESNEKPLLSINFKEETVIEMDVKDTSVFDLIEVCNNNNNNNNNNNSDKSFWDILHNARDIAETLKEKHLTIVLRVKGEETLIIGEKAKPSISQILSKSKNIEIKSVKSLAKLATKVLD
jgi:propanediol dehydratase large subunit